MKAQISQHVTSIEGNKNETTKGGFMKSPRAVEAELFGPNSPLQDRWRVFYFIKYRIQDNKRTAEAEHMSREFIIRNTGIQESNFNRIISRLEKDQLIEVKKGNYRDSVAVYSLNRNRFKQSVIVPDKDKPPMALIVNNSKKGVDNSKYPVDNSTDFDEPKLQNEASNALKLQNEGKELQSEVETPLTLSKLLEKNPSRSLELDPLKITRSLEGDAPRQNRGRFSFLKNRTWGQQSEAEKKAEVQKLRKQKIWMDETNAKISYEEWAKHA